MATRPETDRPSQAQSPQEWWLRLLQEATNRSQATTIEFSKESIRALSLSNGGAAAALLALLGALVKDGGDAAMIRHLAESVLAFGVGLACAVGVAPTSYVVQSFYTGALAGIQRPGDRPTVWQQNLGHCFNALAIALGAASLIAFGCGVWIAYDAFATFGSTQAASAAAAPSPSR